MELQKNETERKTVGEWLYELCNSIHMYFTLVVVDEALLKALQLLEERGIMRNLLAEFLPASVLTRDPYVVYAFRCMNFNAVKISPTCEKVAVLPYNKYKRAAEYWECRRRYVMSEQYIHGQQFGFFDPCATFKHILYWPQYREEYRCVYLDVWRGKRQAGYSYVVFDSNEEDLPPEKMAKLIEESRAYVI